MDIVLVSVYSNTEIKHLTEGTQWGEMKPWLPATILPCLGFKGQYTEA